MHNINNVGVGDEVKVELKDSTIYQGEIWEEMETGFILDETTSLGDMVFISFDQLKSIDPVTKAFV